MKYRKEPARSPRTLVEVCGRDRVLVEEHRGIEHYSSGCIRIGATSGTLVLEGEDLYIRCMSKAQIIIRGTIRKIEWEEC